MEAPAAEATVDSTATTTETIPEKSPATDESKPVDAPKATPWWKKGKGDKKKDEEEDTKKDPNEPPKAPFGNYWKIFGYAKPLDFILIAFGSFAAMGTGVLLPLMTVIFGNVFKDLGTLGPATIATATPEQKVAASVAARKSVERSCLILLGMAIAKFGTAYIMMMCFRLSSTRISGSLRLAFVTKLFRMPIHYFDTIGPGAVAVRITSNAATIQMGIGEKLALCIQFTTMFCTAFIIAFVRQWKITLVTMTIFPAMVLAYGFTIPLTMKIEKEQNQSQDLAATLAEEVFGSIRTVKAFSAQDKLWGKYKVYIDKVKKLGDGAAWLIGTQFAAAWFIIFCAYALSFWFGIKLYNSGEVRDVGVVINVFFAVLMAVFAFGGMAPYIGALVKSASAAAQYFETLALESDIDALTDEGLKLDSVSGHIEFHDVGFEYPSRPDVKVLTNMSISFEPMKTTAIVGSSGSGKSTIVALIERWYDPTSGHISIDSKPVKEVNVKWLRQQIGLVSQEPFLFNATIYENVCYGMIGTEWEHAPEEKKRERVKEVCIQSNAQEFIDRLPDGYDTRVGETGIMLSGGQKQRVAIARSIVSNPSILILDEATSAIDVKSERLVQEALDRVSLSRTTIVIAHRLSTIKKADRIIVLSNGTMAEDGSHEELLQKEGVYWRLVQAQALSRQEADSDSDAEPDLKDSLNREETEPLTPQLTRTKTQASAKALSVQKMKKGLFGREKKPKEENPELTIGFLHAIVKIIKEQKSKWVLYLFVVAAAMGGGSTYPLQAWLFAKITTVYFDNLPGSPRLHQQGNFWSLMFFILAVFVGVSYMLLGYCLTLLSVHLTRNYRLEYFKNIMKQSVPYFDEKDNSAGSLTSRLTTDPTAVQEMTGMNMGAVLVGIFNIIGSITISLIFGWKLALVALCVCMPLQIGGTLYRHRIEIKLQKGVSEVFTTSAQFASEAVGAIRTVASLTVESSIRDKYALLLDTHVKEEFKNSRFAVIGFAASECQDFLTSALVFYYGIAVLVLNGEYTQEQFIVVFSAALQGGQGAGMFLSLMPNIVQAHLSACRIFNIREKGPPPTGDPLEHDTGDDDQAGYSIEFKDVSFKYASRDSSVFRNLNLTVEKGMFAAFVGPSGCGKTTTVSLLERFYELNGGEILVDGKPLASFDPKSYRKAVSLVAQEPTLYQGTLRENILLGIDEDDESFKALSTAEVDSMVVQACKDAFIHDFIISLPEGYLTNIGAKGLSLSGGQKQRVAIGRALIRRPSILLLDEATSALDSESEKMVQAAFEAAAKGRTMIAVAHRLSTIQKADRIFVFAEGGKVVEQGSHAELIRKRGRYAQMCEGQALDA